MSSGEEFLAVSIPDFGGARALTVQEDGVTSEMRNVSLPEDLLRDAPGEAIILLSASNVTVDGDENQVIRATQTVEHQVSVTFRLAPLDFDACSSDTQIGPFDLVTLSNVVTLADESLSLAGAARTVISRGQFGICAQISGDFQGSISIGKVSFEFGKLRAGDERVELCHISPGNPENLHTIAVGSSAVDAHLAHGDRLGPCEDLTGEEDESDTDNDSVPDAADECPDTPADEQVDSTGCSCSQRDGDGDGVGDCDDSCPATPEGAATDSAGCSCSQNDTDGDGVNDCDDACPNSTGGPEVNTNGCAAGQLDDDNDGLTNDVDTCPNTPPNEMANASGCSCSQLDEDGDGVNDCDDFCPNTPADTLVDYFGCEVLSADAGVAVTLDEVGCAALHGSASGGTPPYLYSWSAPGWDGSMEQNPVVVPAQTTTYTLTVTDFSFPPETVTDTVAISIAPHDGLQYNIVDLGSLSTNSSYPAGLNDSGEVVGFFYTDTWQKRAFLYSDGAMIDLGTLGGDEASAKDVNNFGQVVGQSKTASGEWHAFLWDTVDGMQDLGTLGGTSSIANAISDAGQVVGSSNTGTSTQAFVYSDGIMQDVGTLDFLYSEATDVNDLGVVVGTLLVDGSNPDPLIYDDGDLGALGSPLLSANRAWAINNAGLIVGHSWEGTDYRSFLHVCDTTVDLGALAGFPKTSAWGVNDAGQIVGSLNAENSTLFHGFLYTGGQLRNLNDLLVEGHDWEYLAVAFAVNSSGQITGYGRINGQFRGYLLTPIP